MAVKGKNYGFLICIFVMIVDVVAGILGIQAEIAQGKVLNSIICKGLQFSQWDQACYAMINM